MRGSLTTDRTLVGDLIVTTNKNDILHCFSTTGKYHRRDIHKILLPSMDIWFRSNFKWYLYHLTGADTKKLTVWMGTLETTGRLAAMGQQIKDTQADFLRQSSGTTTRRLQQLFSIIK